MRLETTGRSLDQDLSCSGVKASRGFFFWLLFFVAAAREGWGSEAEIRVSVIGIARRLILDFSSS